MTPSRLSAFVTPALAIAGVWALLVFDPMTRVRDRLAGMDGGRADASTSTICTSIR